MSIAGQLIAFLIGLIVIGAAVGGVMYATGSLPKEITDLLPASTDKDNELNDDDGSSDGSSDGLSLIHI